MQLLQSHGKLQQWSGKLAQEFELFDASLIVLNVNNGEFDKALELITGTKDDETRCKLMVKYARILLKNRPKHMLELLRTPGFRSISKIEMIPVFMSMEDDYHNLMLAADYIKDIWITQLELHERSYYNLAFELNLRSLLASRNPIETKQCTRLLDFLEALEFAKMSGGNVHLDEKYATDTLHFQIKENIQLQATESDTFRLDHRDLVISKLKESYLVLLLMAKQFQKAV
jgi:hypothetical protein